MVMNNFYYLYRFRKSHNKYPSDYVGIQIEHPSTWLIIGRLLSYDEVVYYDVEIHGERMNYQEFQAVIKSYSRRSAADER